MSKRRKTPQGASGRGPEVKKRALAMLAVGTKILDVSAELGVDRHTVAKWRDSADGERFLIEARRRADDAINAGLDDYLRLIRTAVPQAINVLIDKLDSVTPTEALSAAREILDRGGVLRGEQITVTSAGPDLSKLTDDELNSYRSLQRKAGAK